MLINVDVIYFASLVKYFGDTEDKSTEKESIKVNIIFKKTNTHETCAYINTRLISSIMTVIAGCIQYCDMHLSTLSHVW